MAKANLLNLQNPIPSSCNSTGEEKEFWDFYKKWIIPYYSDSEGISHRMIKVIYDLCQLSPAFCSIERDIKKFTFGKNLNIGKNKIEGLHYDEFDSSLGQTEKEEFGQCLMDLGLSLMNVLETTKELFDAKLRTGNWYLKIKEVTVLGQTTYNFKVLHPKHTAYLWTKTGAKDRIVHCKKWTKDFFKEENNHSIYYATRFGEAWNWNEKTTNSGTVTIRETVVHGFTKADESDFYGRNNSILANLNNLFVDYKNSDTMCKTVSSTIVSQAVWLFEQSNNNRGGDDNTAENFRYMMSALRGLMTSEGTEPKSMAGLEFPKGATPPQMIPIQINRDTDFLKTTDEMASTKIHSALGAFREITGATQTVGGLGSNQIINLWVLFEGKTIEPEQCEWEGWWNWIFKEIGTTQNKQTLVQNGIKFVDNISPLVAKLDSFNKGNTITNKTITGDENMSDEQRSQNIDFDNLKKQGDTYGVAVRAGLVTPQLKDEIAFREQLGLPEMCEEAKADRKKEGGVKRPITLKSKAEAETEIQSVKPKTPTGNA